MDVVFLLNRQAQLQKPGWTAFNQKYSKVNPEKTTVGYMPIIQAPAHEMETLNMVVSEGFAHYRIPPTEACSTHSEEAVIPKHGAQMDNTSLQRHSCFGALHISMNFLMVSGQHTQDSGLSKIWI